jgi:crossover junction endodeoxyribonuclease RuvC
MKLVVAGIDPGLHGAIALYDADDRRVIEIWDMPTLEIKRGKTIKRRIDLQQLKFIVADLQLFGVSHVYTEDVGGMPGQSAPAAFSFGYAAGVVTGFIAASQIPITAVTASVWKKALGLRGNKDDARMLASELLPAAAHFWRRKKDDGRAEAALIARYGALRDHRALMAA